jgi:hypothetical protein
MKKMAIFTEGRTELEFDSKLIQEIASHKNVQIQTRKFRGAVAKRGHSLIADIPPTGPGVVPTHFFMLFNCVGEDVVKSRMVAEYDSLSANGYTEIICHRDIAPNIPRGDIPKLEFGLPLRVKTNPIRVKFVLSIMEVEAWFLSEHAHFEAIDPAITPAAISAALGFNPATDDMQLRDNPAQDLNACYALAGKIYDKYNSQTTIDAIDCVSVYFDLTAKFPYLGTLCTSISDFLDTA